MVVLTGHPCMVDAFKGGEKVAPHLSDQQLFISAENQPLAEQTTTKRLEFLIIAVINIHQHGDVIKPDQTSQ